MNSKELQQAYEHFDLIDMKLWNALANKQMEIQQLKLMKVVDILLVFIIIQFDDLRVEFKTKYLFANIECWLISCIEIANRI